jgi:uncharacterized MAPEG superfamily protein
MTPELTALALAALLQGLQFVLYAVPANRDLGPGYTRSARDRPPSRGMSETTARLGRAMDNHFEGLILFGIAVLVATLGGRSGALTAACAWTYLAARVLYVPAYALGWRPWRSVIWMVGFGATMLMILAALLAPAPAAAGSLRDLGVERTFHAHGMCIGCACPVHPRCAALT